MKNNKTKWKLPTGYTTIPQEVRYSRAISAGAKLLYGDIKGLSFEKGYCSASNEYFAFCFDVDDKTISEWVNQLYLAGFIKREITKKSLRKLYPLIGKIIRKNPTTLQQNNETPKELTDTPLSEKADTNNIIYNTTTTNVVATHQFNLSEEIKKLLSYKSGDYRWLRIIGLFIAYRRMPYTDNRQINELKGKFKKCATSIATFDEQRVERAFAFCDRMKDSQGNKINWNLSTVEKQLLTNPNL
jgi:hypothetical protein